MERFLQTAEGVLLPAFLGINALTFLLYGLDKRFAKKGMRRIPEKTLMGFAVVFGAPGALLGMLMFRHKTKHKKFIITVPLFLLLQAGFFIALTAGWL